MQSSFLRTAVTGTLAAVIAVTILWLVARVTGDDLRVQTPGSDSPEKMAIFYPAVAVIFNGLIGAGIVWLLRKRSNGRVIFLGLAVVVVIFQGISAFTATDSDGTAIWLNVMHLAAAGAIVPVYLRLFARSI